MPNDCYNRPAVLGLFCAASLALLVISLANNRRKTLRPGSHVQKSIRCLLVHDHVLLRQGLRRLLEDEPDFEVVGEAENVTECVRQITEFQPDVIISDPATFGLSISEAELLLQRESANAKLFFLTAQQPSTSTFDGQGMSCPVAPQMSLQDLVNTIRDVCGTRATFLETSSADHAPRNPPAPEQEHILTAREREVVELLAEGKTVRSAATALGLSSKTVDAHKFNLMRKLGVHNKAQLVMWAVRERIVKIPTRL
jgi:DNA-binding NarL/FixJ family response regulator